MAVQAQYPIIALSPDFATMSRNNVMLEELQSKLQQQQSMNPFRGYNNYVQQGFNGTAVFSDPESELTCNVSFSRKRNRVEQQQEQELNRMNQSEKTSTSGRSSAVNVPYPSPFSHDLASIFYQQNLEIDTLIKLENEKLRLGLEEKRKKHCRAFVSVLGQQIQKKLGEKELELESLTQRNAELEEKVKQMSMESEIWQRVAKNNEAIATNLRTSLEQALIRGNSREGYGESKGAVNVIADDAQSCCYESKESELGSRNTELDCRKTCRACRKNEISVLLLPCRHLCLCKDCESMFDCCPLCQTPKNASLQIFMS